METLTPIQKLDTILFHIKDNPILLYNQNGASVEFNGINDDPETKDEELVRILKKLIIDNFAYEVIEPRLKTYAITFDGYLFAEAGGYKEKVKRDNQINPLRKLKTGLINSAALAAGVYYVLEILRIYIMPVFQHVCDCHFVWQNIAKLEP